MALVITKRDVINFLKSMNLDVAEVARHARSAGCGAATQDALTNADLNGDGAISGAREAAALFDGLDEFDSDGSRNTISMKSTDSIDELLARLERTRPRRSGDVGGNAGARPPRVRRGLSGAGDGGAPGELASGDTLSASTRPGSTLRDPMQIDRRYQGSGPVDVARDGARTTAFQFTGGMQVDTDGGKSALARSDRYYQSETSMRWRGGESLNADNVPFIVLPPSLAKATGAKLGDLVEVSKGGKTMYAIYGDVGPSAKLGEGSLGLARAFDRRAGPNRGIDGGVTYTVLPGSGAQAGIKNGGPKKTSDEIQRAGAAAFARARTDGVIEVQR